uniref:Serine/threonine-protein kinase-like protein CCR3 n=2 Tax=Elaeis guineensis var. tenera TaxID=51953 RepID=A0A8N4FAJ0_ELAGV|nr:putative serine/threonine-protein kinase-like protein CCR3 [Elaeis guineensis]
MEFTFAELTIATKSFSLDTKIIDGAGVERRSPISEGSGDGGYMDIEYYGLHHLIVKSDVYELGVVMLEVLTEKRAIFKNGEGGDPTSVVDYAVPRIVARELARVIDSRVSSSEANEMEAVKMVAYTMVHCMSLEGKDRPFMADVVTKLERFLALCEDSHGSISSTSIFLASVD